MIMKKTLLKMMLTLLLLMGGSHLALWAQGTCPYSPNSYWKTIAEVPVNGYASWWELPGEMSDGKLKLTSNAAWASGGISFDNAVDGSKVTYLHVAIYAVSATNVWVRIADGDGVDGTYNNNQVNSKTHKLTQGWNELCLPIQVDDIASRDQAAETAAQKEFAYTDPNSRDFDVSSINQVGFIVVETGKTIYVDQVYFYTIKAKPNMDAGSQEITYAEGGISKTSIKENLALDDGGNAWHIVAAGGDEVIINNYNQAFSDKKYVNVDVWPVNTDLTSIRFAVWYQGATTQNVTFDVTPGQWNRLSMPIPDGATQVHGIRFQRGGQNTMNAGDEFVFANVNLTGTFQIPESPVVEHTPKAYFWIDDMNGDTHNSSSDNGNWETYGFWTNGDNKYLQLNGLKGYRVFDGYNINASGDGYMLHFDVLPLQGDANQWISVFPKSGNDNPTDAKADAAGFRKQVTPYVWNSFDVSLSALTTGDNALAASGINTIAFVGDASQNARYFAIDNVYLWKDELSYPTPVDYTGKVVMDVPAWSSQQVAGALTDLSGATFSTVQAEGYDVHKVVSTGNEVVINNAGSPVQRLSIGDMEHIRVDVYPEEGLTQMLFHVWFDGKDDLQKTFDVTPGEWNTLIIDIPASYKNANYGGIRFDKDVNNTRLDTGLTFYYTNVYAYKDNTHGDTDGKGINWNFAHCYVQNVYDPHGSTNGGGTNQTGYAHDNNNEIANRYSTIMERDANANVEGYDYDDKWLLVKLSSAIKVSDVEIIWGQNPATDYEVYVASENPTNLTEAELAQNTGDDGYRANPIDETKLTKLYERTGLTAPNDPYFDIESNLQSKDGNIDNAQWVAIHMMQRASKFFGYIIADIHVGAASEDYNTVAGIGLDDQRTTTGYENRLQNVTVTARNSRNAALTDKVDNATITCDSPYVKLTQNNDGSYTIYATEAGDYTLNISGTVNGTAYNSTASLTVFRAWKESIVQTRPSSSFDASYSEFDTKSGTYCTADKAGDTYVSGDQNFRWSSLQGDGVGSKTWDDNEWWVVDLGENYSLQEMEVVWEGAYAKSYDVFALTAEEYAALYDAERKVKEDGVTDPGNTTMDNNVENYTSTENLIFSRDAALSSPVFPYHETITNLPTSKANVARYLLIRLNTRATDYGFSMWEVYADGIKESVLDALQKLEAPDIDVMWGYNTKQTAVDAVPADGTERTAENTISNFYPVDFNVSGSGLSMTKNEEGDGDNKVTTWTLKKGDDVVATILDNRDGTFEIKSGDKIENIVGEYTITMTGVKYNQETDTSNPGNTITGTFKLTVTKERSPMKLDPAKTTAPRHGYDDGYYSEEVLKADSDPSVTVIDLTTVWFKDNGKTAGEEGYKTFEQVELPAPYTVKSDDTRQNPNAVYYVDRNVPATEADRVNTIHGENVAYKDGQQWRIHDLRIFDGWDYAPEGGIAVKRARFYTNVPRGKKSLFVIPFAPRYSDVNGKDIKLYAPSAFNSSDNTITLTKRTQDEVENSAGVISIITTDNPDNYTTKANSFKVVFNNVQWTSGMTLDSAPWTSLLANIPEVSVGTGATLNGSYVMQKLTDRTLENGEFYLYDSHDDTFKVHDSQYFNYTGENGGLGKLDNEIPISNYDKKDYRSTVRPFFAYLTLTESSANPANAIRLLFEDEVETDGITLVNSDLPTHVNVYTIDGMMVKSHVELEHAFDGLAKGIYIVNGKKIIK